MSYLLILQEPSTDTTQSKNWNSMLWTLPSFEKIIAVALTLLTTIEIRRLMNLIIEKMFRLRPSRSISQTTRCACSESFMAAQPSKRASRAILEGCKPSSRITPTTAKPSSISNQHISFSSLPPFDMWRNSWWQAQTFLNTGVVKFHQSVTILSNGIIGWWQIVCCPTLTSFQSKGLSAFGGAIPRKLRVMSMQKRRCWGEIKKLPCQKAQPHQQCPPLSLSAETLPLACLPNKFKGRMLFLLLCTSNASSSTMCSDKKVQDTYARLLWRMQLNTAVMHRMLRCSARCRWVMLGHWSLLRHSSKIANICSRCPAFPNAACHPSSFQIMHILCLYYQTKD